MDLVKGICDVLDERLASESSFAEQIEFVEDRPGHDKRYAIDAEKIRTELGWKPKVSLNKGLRATIDWYLSNDAWINNIANTAKIGHREGTSAK